MAVNKLEINGVTEFDLTEDTVTPAALLQGYTAHNAAGNPIVGSALTGGISITKLWENASPSSTFASQSITMDLSGYDFILVGEKPYTTYSNSYNIYHTCRVDGMTLMTCIENSRLYQRSIEVYPTYVKINIGNRISTYGTSTQDNDRAIPIVIYGISGVQSS